MQRAIDASPPNGTLFQLMPRGHASMGFAQYFMWDSSCDAAVIAWLEGLIAQVKAPIPTAVVAPTEVLDKTNTVVAELPPLNEHEKAVCTCGHIRRVHANLVLDCCEGACKCGAFELAPL